MTLKEPAVQENMATKETRPFGFRDKLGYLLGDFGNDFFFILTSSFLMVFYTDIFGCSLMGCICRRSLGTFY